MIHSYSYAFPVKEASLPSMVKKTGKKSKDSPGSRPSTPSNVPPSAGYLISCDVPTKNFICYLNDLKSIDKRFILEDLDATHLLVKTEAKAEIMHEVEKWQDSNVFSAVETVGENLDTS